LEVRLSGLVSVGISWLLLTTTAFAFIERKIERTFDVSEKAVFKLDTVAGMVRVVEDADAKVIRFTVIQTADAETEKEMDALVEVVDIDMQQSKTGLVSVSTRFRRPLVWTWENWPPVSLAYEVHVPRHCDVTIVTGEGQIDVSSMTGRLTLDNERGDIFTGEIDGAITTRSRSGSIGITACTGEISATTRTGNITVGRAAGLTQLSSSGGYIELQRASGKVVVRGDGSDAQIGFTTPVKYPADIVLSGGTLVLQVEKDSACTLDLRSSIFGKVSLRGQLHLAITGGGLGKSSLQAAVNGGGTQISARAKGGSVQLRALDPLPQG
jgi:hypothetical protein